jgi:hypothetical protein
MYYFHSVKVYAVYFSMLLYWKLATEHYSYTMIDSSSDYAHPLYTLTDTALRDDEELCVI